MGPKAWNLALVAISSKPNKNFTTNSSKTEQFIGRKAYKGKEKQHKIIILKNCRTVYLSMV